MSNAQSLQKTSFKRRGKARSRLKWFVGALLIGLVALLFLFPVQRLGIAFTIATGVGRDALQERIDALEEKAIRGVKPSGEEREFLLDFYASLATGGKLSIVARQTGGMMDHYLEGSGSAYSLDPVIFTQNHKVQHQAEALRSYVILSECAAGQRFSSATFYMPDKSKLDSVFGLYHGKLYVTPSVDSDGACQLHWRAEVPWVWPSYASLTRKYGSPHAESFPIPSLRSLIFGRQHALFVDNGLGAYLEEMGIAKSFLAFAEWSETQSF